MKIISLITFSLLSISSFAGPGHNHDHGHSHPHGSHGKKQSINKLQAKTLAMDRIKVLVFKGKIDSSWRESKFQKSTKIKEEWLVTYTNENGLNGKTIYIFLDLSGKFVAANFTGK